MTPRLLVYYMVQRCCGCGGWTYTRSDKGRRCLTCGATNYYPTEPLFTDSEV